MNANEKIELRKLKIFYKTKRKICGRIAVNHKNRSDILELQ